MGFTFNFLGVDLLDHQIRLSVFICGVGHHCPLFSFGENFEVLYNVVELEQFQLKMRGHVTFRTARMPDEHLVVDIDPSNSVGLSVVVTEAPRDDGAWPGSAGRGEQLVLFVFA